MMLIGGTDLLGDDVTGSGSRTSRLGEHGVNINARGR